MPEPQSIPSPVEDTLPPQAMPLAAETAAEEAGAPPERTGRARLAYAWACLLLIASSTVCGTCLARYQLDGVFLLNQHEYVVLVQLIIVHACIAFMAAGLLIWQRSPLEQPGAGLIHRRNTTALRILMMVTPIWMFVASDRVCSFFIPPQNYRTMVFQPDRDLGWRHRPGATGNWFGAVTINKQGLRGPAVPYEKAPGEFRVLFLGDSITFCQGVPYDEGFVMRLQKKLQDDMPDRKVTTVNAGVSGYSPWQELRWLQREGYKYKPDLIIQGFCLNDVTSKYGLLRFGGTDEAYEVKQAASELEWSGLYRLFREIRISWLLGGDRKAGARQAATLEVQSLFDNDGSPRVQKAWQETLANMDKIVARAEADNVPLVIAVFPFLLQLPDTAPPARPQQRLTTYAEKKHVTLCDVLPTMKTFARAHPQGPDLLWDRCHPTSAGHRLIADELYECLRQHGLLPRKKAATSD